MSDTHYNVLFLCTGNSARSLIAEAILATLGKGRFTAYSAGSQPTGMPNPGAIAILEKHGIDTAFARSKSWDEFAGDDAEDMDVIITVCGNAADESCPLWPGHPMTAHWGVEDPAAVKESQSARDAAFAKTFAQMQRRIDAFIALDRSGDKDGWLEAVRAIGLMTD